MLILTEIFQTNVIAVGFGNQLDEVFVIHLTIVHGTIAKWCLRYLHVTDVWFKYLWEYLSFCFKKVANIFTNTYLEVMCKITVQTLAMVRIEHNLQIRLIQFLYQLDRLVIGSKIVIWSRSQWFNETGYIEFCQILSTFHQKLFDGGPGV